MSETNQKVSLEDAARISVVLSTLGKMEPGDLILSTRRLLRCANACEDAAKLIATLVDALETVINDDWRMSCDWGPSDERKVIMDKARAALALARKELP